jgi:hypothetical protein
MRRHLNIIAAFALFASAEAADDLPLKAPGPATELDLSLLPKFAGVPDLPAVSVVRIEAALERAKKSAASGERMFRAGIIAKVDAEKRALKVVQLTADLAAARSEAARLELDARREEFGAGKASQQQFDAAQASADAADEAAAAAAATRARAELADAEINLGRQRRLLAAGAGSKALVARAQSKLAALKNKTQPLHPDPVNSGRGPEF